MKDTILHWRTPLLAAKILVWPPVLICSCRLTGNQEGYGGSGGAGWWGEDWVQPLWEGSEALVAHTFKFCPHPAFQPLPLWHSILPSPWVITDGENLRLRGSRPGFCCLLYSHALAGWFLWGPLSLCLVKWPELGMNSGIPPYPDIKQTWSFVFTYRYLRTWASQSGIVGLKS